MTDVITGTFQVAKSRVSWALPLDPVELAGETIWVRP